MPTIAALLRERLTEWRHAPEVSPYKLAGKVVASEVALLGLTAVALVEAVVYAIFTGLSGLFYCLHHRPFEAGWLRLRESGVTLGRLCVDVAYRNFQVTLYKPFVPRPVAGAELVAAQIGENIETARKNIHLLDLADQKAWDWSLFILQEVIGTSCVKHQNFGQIEQVIEGLETVDAGSVELVFSTIIELFVVGSHQQELLPDFLSDNIRNIIRVARRKGELEGNEAQGKWAMDHAFHRACQFAVGIFKHPQEFLFNERQARLEKVKRQAEEDRGVAAKAQSDADAELAARLARRAPPVPPAAGPLDLFGPPPAHQAFQGLPVRALDGMLLATALAASETEQRRREQADELAAHQASLESVEEYYLKHRPLSHDRSGPA